MKEVSGQAVGFGVGTCVFSSDDEDFLGEVFRKYSLEIMRVKS